MLSTWEQYSWVHQRVKQLELSLILDLNILPLLLHSVMTKHQETSNSRNMIHFLALLFKEIN